MCDVCEHFYQENKETYCTNKNVHKIKTPAKNQQELLYTLYKNTLYNQLFSDIRFQNLTS